MTWEKPATWKECGITLLTGIALAVAGASLLAPFIWLAFCAVGLSPMTWGGLLTLWLILLGIGFVWLLFATALMVRELYSKKSGPPPGSTHSTMVMEINPGSRAGESASSSSALIIARLETSHSTKPPRTPRPPHD